ncbi:allantoinase AllB [Saccharothrix luteola]|uniref:allantoinase AllB n=1 Tax=Saccharothrix luteola TaxID=2893018 RepID=UPI001E65D500|nr:allantoinase AllB [Saccharothrix luteola]MCC8245698.1 allantoinase AllB [Saccharothrix luteola]
MDLVLRAARVITPDGERRADVGVAGGRIVEVADHLDAGTVVTLADDEVLLPGLVDTHVHVNDPGRSDWEGFETATRAAAAGGVTTIIDMPLNSVPPTTTVAALKAKREAARDRAHVDVGFWGGIVPTNLDDLEELHDAGVFGFKCFLIHSGVDEFPHVTEDELRAALLRLRGRDALTIVHAEDPLEVTDSGPGYRAFLDSRPHRAEQHAITTVVDLANETRARLHVLHLSSGEAVRQVRIAKDLGLRLTAETCPHYLTFVAEEIGDTATEFKCCPPIRDAANREQLWRALGEDLIDLVVTDHSPCTPELKQGDFATAWGGIASLQLGLSAVWTQARQRGHALTDVVRWMATNPADLVGLGTKGRIAPGADADFCVFAPDDAFVVDRAALRHRNPVTPYHGRPLAGVVRQTWLRGRPIDDRPRGRLLSHHG